MVRETANQNQIEIFMLVYSVVCTPADIRLLNKGGGVRPLAVFGNKAALESDHLGRSRHTMGVNTHSFSPLQFGEIPEVQEVRMKLSGESDTFNVPGLCACT